MFRPKHIFWTIRNFKIIERFVFAYHAVNLFVDHEISNIVIFMLWIYICTIKKYVYTGFYKGLWDNTCSKPCPATCVEGHCYPSNGTCVWGCNPDNCLNDICDETTGKCTDGCKIGLLGDNCDKRKFTNSYWSVILRLYNDRFKKWTRHKNDCKYTIFKIIISTLRFPTVLLFS